LLGDMEADRSEKSLVADIGSAPLVMLPPLA
jgi:hypothetical protein